MSLNRHNTATVRIPTVTAKCLIWYLRFFSVFPQNGQTALSVAEAAAHQDIVNLLKAPASEPMFATELLWVRVYETIPAWQPANSSISIDVLQSTEREKAEISAWHSLRYTSKTWICILTAGTGMFLLFLCQHALWVFVNMLHQLLKEWKGNGQTDDETLP